MWREPCLLGPARCFRPQGSTGHLGSDHPYDTQMYYCTSTIHPSIRPSIHPSTDRPTHGPTDLPIYLPYLPTYYLPILSIYYLSHLSYRVLSYPIVHCILMPSMFFFSSFVGLLWKLRISELSFRHMLADRACLCLLLQLLQAVCHMQWVCPSWKKQGPLLRCILFACLRYRHFFNWCQWCDALLHARLNCQIIFLA